MGFLSAPLGWVMWLIYQVVPNFTLALLVFTIFTRLIMFPFSVKSQKNMARMAAFRPKIEQLNKKYANNKQKLQEETMKLYEQEGYNPMGGCLPSLIPMIIMFGLINVVYNPLTHIARLSNDVITQATEIGKGLVENFDKSSAVQIAIVNAVHGNPSAFSALGAENIAKIQHIDLNLMGINLGDKPTLGFNLLVLIPILSGLTSLAVSLYSMHKSQQTQGQQAGGGMMKGMMIFMPLLSVFFAFNVPAGVGLYWIFSNVLSGVQTLVLYKIWTPERVAAKFERDKAAGKIKEKKPSKLRQAMLAAQEQQAAQQGQGEAKKRPLPAQHEGMTQKEINELNRRRLAEARRRDAEKYGEEYVEVTDEDLK